MRFFRKCNVLSYSGRSWTVCGRLLWLSVSGSSWREWPICWRESAPCCRTRHIPMLLSSSPMLHSSLNWPALVTPSMLLLITILFPCTQTSQAELHLNLYEFKSQPQPAWTNVGQHCVHPEHCLKTFTRLLQEVICGTQKDVKLKKSECFLFLFKHVLFTGILTQ